MSNWFLFGKKKDFFWVSPQFTGWFGPILRHKFSTQSIFNLHIAPFLLYFVPNLSKNKSLQFASIELFQFGPSVFLTFNDFHLFWWDLQESESAKLLFTASHFYLSIVLSHCNFWVTSTTFGDLKKIFKLRSNMILLAFIEAHFMDGSQKGRQTPVSNVGVALKVLKEMISAHL